MNELPEDDGTGENTGRQEEPEETIEPYYSPDTTPAAADLTAAPKAENTPVPEMQTQDDSASGGSVRVRVFNDKNTNGEQGPYETGASGVTVYLLEADGETPAAFVEVSLLGRSDRAHFERMTKELCAILSDVLSIRPDRVYVKYTEVDHWGWNGGNF